MDSPSHAEGQPLTPAEPAGQAGSEENTDPNCIFCRIAAGEVPAQIVYASDDVVAFRDLNPQAPTHILLIPRRHVTGISDPRALDGSILTPLFSAAVHVAQREGLGEGGYRLVFNVGPDAGQSVFHLHLHLLGGRQLGWPPG